MAPRRRKTSRRKAPKVFSISAIEAGTALSLAASTGAAQSVQAMLKGDVANGLKMLETNVMKNKQKIVGTLAAAFVGKALTKGFNSGRLAKLGPIAIKA